ncbi:MAG: hypothetical protein K8F93_17160 [Burkholderiales bacterium]|nr:hypothetical protein [Burkholderiales bacterium]MBZ0251386.1 hypothetical protein [Burkholderiales bacterium]
MKGLLFALSEALDSVEEPSPFGAIWAFRANYMAHILTFRANKFTVLAQMTEYAPIQR